MIWMQRLAAAMEGLIAHSRAANEPALSTTAVQEVVRRVQGWTSGEWEPSQIDTSQMPSNDINDMADLHTDPQTEPDFDFRSFFTSEYQ
jgi:hypothetical protein